MKNKLLACILALSTLAPAAPVFAAETTAAPAEIDAAAYAYLLENQRFSIDPDNDGIITDAELETADYLWLDLTDVKDISWLARLKNVRSVSLSNGTLTDFSVLEKMPALVSMDMTAVPVTELSFLDKLHLDYCSLRDMPQITDAERIAHIHSNDISLTAGTDGRIELKPEGLIDNPSYKIADGEIAQFEGLGTETDFNCDFYARKVGETTYAVYSGDTKIAGGKITVKKAPPAFDPPLQSAVLDGYTVNASRHYYTPDPETGAAGTAALIGSTLYSFSGKEVKIVEQNVKQYENVYLRNTKGQYINGDIILTRSGAWRVNGELAVDVGIREIRGEYAIGDNHRLYMLEPDGDTLKAVVLAPDADYFVPNCDKLYYATDGTVRYYNKTGLTGRPTIGTTHLSEPLFSAADKTGLSAVYYLVDQNHDLYRVEFEKPKYTNLKTTKLAGKVTDLRYTTNDKGAIVLQYTTEDGTVKPLLEMSYGSTYSNGIVQMMHWGALNLDVGAFYIHELQNDGITENDAVIQYYLDANHELRFRFLDDAAGLTHVKGELCSTYDQESRSGLLWFVREDGTIWYYDLKAKQWNHPLGDKQPSIDVPGDANGDGFLTVADAILLSKYLSGTEKTLAKWSAADMNHDGRLNAVDLSMVKRFLMITGGGSTT